MNKIMKASDNCINLITKFEGCKLTAYRDSVGVLTIGYGHTSGVKEGQEITKDEAIAFLKSDLKKAENAVNEYDSTYHWSQNQFDALVSFAFNVGGINQLTAGGTRSISEISAKILAYNKAGGRTLKGLTNRRNAEKELFDKTAATSAKVIPNIPTYIVTNTYNTVCRLKVHKDHTLDSQVLKVYAQNTRFTCKSKLVDNDGNVWLKTPSGWVCAYLISKNEVYVK